ncbi:MAG: hypothetical protein CMI54_02375, partial [Parcubacteria group bacterium]|nr:hypothetical protein [Parcubacteria group bacterium]
MSYLQNRGIHVDRHLSNIAINYRPGPFIADMVFPVANVEKQSNIYAVWDQGDLFRIYKTDRAPGHEANKIEAQVSSGSYFCNNYALKADVTIEDRANADAIFVSALEAGRVQRVMDGLMLDWEDRVATQVTNTANVGTSANVGSSWTDWISVLYTVMCIANPVNSGKPQTGKLWAILSEAHKLWERATTILFRSTLQAIGSGSAGHPS